jgi:hypothetical protein
MSDANLFKKGMDSLIFSTPIRLHGKDFYDRRIFQQESETQENFSKTSDLNLSK